MGVCERCWADSKMRARNNPNKDQYQHYLDLLKERKETPCTLAEQKGESMGWQTDISQFINLIGKDQFTLKELYEYIPRMKWLHPDNKNIKAKIRQQLQKLRDLGEIKFLGNGQYEISGKDNE